MNQMIRTYQEQLEALSSIQALYEEQKGVIQQLKEDDENRKKKFMLEKNKHDQEMEEANQAIAQLNEQLTQVRIHLDF